LLRQKKAGDFVIMNYAVDPEHGWLAGSGRLIKIARDELKIKGLEIILDNLLAFDDRIFEQSEFAAWTMSEKRRFYQSHDDVKITLRGQKQLELQPMVPARTKIGSHGDKKDVIALELPTTSSNLWKSLVKAYSRCKK
jgi:hypothetical protein